MKSRRQFLKAGAAIALSAACGRTSLAADQPHMATRQLPGTNERLPVVGLGNARAFADRDMDLSRQLVSILLDHGGSYVDTSGPSRFTIASIMQERDAQEFIFAGTYVESTADDEIRQDIASVRNAQGGDAPLDLVLTRNIAAYEDNPGLYRGLQDDDLTRFVGVARHQLRYHETMVRLMRDDHVDFVQVNYSMLEPEAADSVLPLAKDRGVAVLVNRPFINGRYFGIVKGHPLPEWAAEFDCESWAQFAVKWILGHPAVHCVLTETSNPRHALDNLGSGVGRLPDEKTRQRMQRLILEMA